MTTKESTEETSPSQDATVDLEMDELNQHECMAAMTALIGHMRRNGITPKIEEVSGAASSRVHVQRCRFQNRKLSSASQTGSGAE